MAYLSSDNMLLIEDERIASRIATLHYTTYAHLDEVQEHLRGAQCRDSMCGQPVAVG